MKQKISIFPLTMMIAAIAISSCSGNIRKGDLRDSNIKRATLSYLDSIPEVEYVGMSDTHELPDNKFQAVVIFYTFDSIGNKIEHNSRVLTNDDCTTIHAWKDLDTKVLCDIQNNVSDKMEEKGISIDDNMIDAIINLKNK